MTYYSVETNPPPMDTEVLAGFWYKDPWLVEEKAWRFMAGVCYARKPEDRYRDDFPKGYQWQTFGPSHNQITHWTYMPKPPELETNS